MWPTATEVVIAAASARRYAQAAAAAGFRVHAFDRFGDRDLRDVCVREQRLPLTSDRALDAAALVAAMLESGAGVVILGAPLDQRPEIAAALGLRVRLAGSGPAALFRLRQPEFLRAALIDAGFDEPPGCARVRYGETTSWLLKRSDGTGGQHVVPANSRRVAGQREYFQHSSEGRSLSATFVSGPGACLLLGFVEHYALQHEPTQPYRQSALVAHPAVPARLAEQFEQAGARLSEAVGLRGCWGADFILAPDGAARVVEVNGRPPASFELLADPAAVFAAHVNGSSGDAPPSPRRRVHASATLYAESAIRISNSLDWPEWVEDRPVADSTVASSEPICTVTAAAGTHAAALELLRQRFETARTRVARTSGFV